MKQKGELMTGLRICVLVFIGCTGLKASAQLINSTVTSSSIGSSYSENHSINWSLGGPNWFAGVNNQVASPFGPSTANGGLSGGFGFGGNRASGGLGFNFAQGSNRTMSGTSQSLTTMDGQSGSFFSGTVRPFVIGLTPVVGGYPTGPAGLGEMAAADQKQRLSAIAQGNLDRRYDKMRSYLMRAERAEADGDLKKARANYSLAFRMADEPLRSMIQSKLSERPSPTR